MQQGNQFQPAGQAVEKNGSRPFNPIGLYKNSDGVLMGALDPAAADAYVQMGFTLVAEGTEEARKATGLDGKPSKSKETE